MRATVWSVCVATAWLLAGAVCPAAAQGASPVGQWDAVVKVSNGTVEIPCRFEIVASGSGYRGYFFDGDVKVPSAPGTFDNGTVDLRFDQYGARLVATLAGDGKHGAEDSPARFNEPAGLSAAGGKLYVADTNNHRIRVVDTAGGAVSTLSIPGFILGESALSLLGLGVQEPSTSWGSLLSDAQNLANLDRHPWILAPGVLKIGRAHV